MTEGAAHATTLRDYLRVAKRRKWAIAQALVLVPAAAVLFSLQQQPLYEASAEVLLSRQNLAASLTGTPDPNTGLQPDRLAQTQAGLARVPLVAQRVLDAARVADRTPKEFLESSSASARANADLLEFTVTDPDPALAARLATEYARQFTLYRRELDTGALVRARQELEVRIAELERERATRSALYASLVEKQQQLRTMEALQTSNAHLVRHATEAVQVQPRPVRNGVLGLALGLVLGLGLAFLWEALDTRVRSADEIRHALGLPLLARLPKPPRRLQKRNRLVMLEAPDSAQAEAFRMLRTNLDFVNLERRAKTIMVTSAVEAEGKSTTVANLAVALARAGRRVVLVDLDLRRPFLARFFGLEDKPGLTDAALGHVDVVETIFNVALVAPGTESPVEGGNGSGPIERILEVVPSGPIPPDPGEFVTTRAFAGYLAELRKLADVVLIDSPPLLRVGDPLALSALVDALIVVTRLDVVRRPMLAELRRVLDATPAEKLGFVLTAAQDEEGYGYGGYYHAYAREEAAGQKARVG